MPEPKENPQATPTDPRLLRERAIAEAQREREGLALIGDQARRTGRSVRELLAREQPRTPSYQRFFLGSTPSEMVIQSQTGDRIDISYSGATERVMQDLATHYPSSAYAITQQGNVVEVRKKSGGPPVARAEQNHSPRFLRAIIAYDQAVDRGTLMDRNRGIWEQAGMTTILCSNPGRIIVDGDARYNIHEYLECIHGVRTALHPRWPAVLRMQTAQNETVDVITDARTLNVLRVLRPLAQRASQDAAARQTLRDHLRHIDLPSSAWRTLIEDFFGPGNLPPDRLTALIDAAPHAIRPRGSLRSHIQRTNGTFSAEQWRNLEEAGFVDIAPPENVRETGLEMEQNAGAVQMVVRGNRGSIDLNAEWLQPRGWTIVDGNRYEYDVLDRHIIFPTDCVHDRDCLLSIYHEIGHITDPNVVSLSRETLSLTGRAGSIHEILRDRNFNGNNRETLMRRFILLQRRRAVILKRLESYAWGDAFERTRDTRRRTGQDIVRDRFQNCTQFVGCAMGDGYYTYCPVPNDVLIPGHTQPHMQSYLEFGQNLYRLNDFADSCRFHWAESEIEAIAALSGTERQKALELFNFRYGPFLSKKFHPLRQCGDGRYLAINGQGVLHPYENEQAYKAARDSAPVEATPITTRWWTGFSPAARAANYLEHFHRFANDGRAFDLTFDQLDILERTILGTGGPSETVQRITALRDALIEHRFTPKQIELLLYGGFFGKNIADHLRTTIPKPDLQNLSQRIAAICALEDFGVNQQRITNPNGEPVFTTLHPAQQTAIAQAVDIGEKTSVSVETRLSDIRRALIPHFSQAQYELMIWEGHFDLPGENSLATRGRIFTNLNLAGLPLHQRIWFRGGLDTTISRADMIKVAQDLKIDLTNLASTTDSQLKEKVQERVNTITSRKG